MSASFNNSSVANNSTSSGSHPDRIVRLVFFWLIIVVGLVGNSFIVAVIIFFRRMRTTTNYLLVNVAVADITTLLFTAMHFIPIKEFPVGALGSFLCKFVYTNNITMVTLLVSTLTLTLLAVERYHAMVKPLIVSRRITNEQIAYVIFGIWLVAIAMVTPLFVSVDHRPNSRSLCSPGDNFDEMKVYVYCLVTILTLIPFIVIAFCYTRIISGLYFGNNICNRGVQSKEEMTEKKRLVMLLMALTGVFFVAFVPYGVALILKFSGMANSSLEERRIFARFQTGVQYLTLLNCSTNLFIYAIPSTNYRCCFKYIFKKIFCQDTGNEYEDIELQRRRNPTV